MAGLGQIFVELQLDRSKFTAAEQDVLAKSIGTTVELEKNWQNLGLHSAAYASAMRDSINKSYEAIKTNGLTTAADIARAEEAKNVKIAALNKAQFGDQTSLMSSLKANWIATSVAIGSAMGLAYKAFDAMQVGAKAMQSEEAFKNTAAAVGANADEWIADLKRVTNNTIDDSALMQKAMKGVTGGLDPAAMVSIGEISRVAARRMGVDVGEAFSTITDAIETQRVRALRMYGLVTPEQTRWMTAIQSTGREFDLLGTIMANVALKHAMMGPTIQNEVEAIQKTKAEYEHIYENMGKILWRAGEIALKVAEWWGSAPQNAAKAPKGPVEDIGSELATPETAQALVDQINDNLKASAAKGMYDKLAIGQAEFKKKVDELNPALAHQENLIQGLIASGEILKAQQNKEAGAKGMKIDTSWIDEEVQRGAAFINAGFPKRMGIKLQFEIDKIGMSELETRIADINQQATDMRKKEGDRPEIKAWQDKMVNQATFNDALKLSITINENLYEVEKKRIDIQQQLKGIDIEATAKGLTDRIEAEKQINQYRLQYAEISPIESINRETEASKALIAVERDRLMDQIALRSVRADSEEAQAVAWVANKQALAEIAVGNQKVLDLETQRLYKLKELTGTFSEGENVGYTQFAIAQGSNYQQGVTYATDIASGAKDTFKNIFFDGMRNQWKTAADYADIFVQHLQNALADLAAKNLMLKILGKSGEEGWLGTALGVVGGLFGIGGGSQAVPGIAGGVPAAANYVPGVMHGGGIVGESSVPSRSIPASYFSNAPRLHGGLAEDEYPAILQRGETVTPKGKSKGGPNSSTTDASATNNYYYIQAVDAKSFAELCRANPAAVSGPVMQQIRDNKIRTEFKNLLR